MLFTTNLFVANPLKHSVQEFTGSLQLEPSEASTDEDQSLRLKSL